MQLICQKPGQLVSKIPYNFVQGNRFPLVPQWVLTLIWHNHVSGIPTDQNTCHPSRDGSFKRAHTYTQRGRPGNQGYFWTTHTYILLMCILHAAGHQTGTTPDHSTWLSTSCDPSGPQCDLSSRSQY